jgi:hypothetical protein
MESAGRVALLSHLRRKHADLEYAAVHMLRFEGEGCRDLEVEIPRDSPNQLGMF